jgi:DNA-binding NarL/FixJ family response regulator
MSAGARAKVVILTTYGLDEYTYTALRAGAAGFMSKRNRRRGISEGGAHGGRRRCAARLGDDTVADRAIPIRTASRDTPASRLGELISPEHEVLLEVAHRRSNEEIPESCSSARGR